jgi:Protein of unknown function (DUF3106)
MPKRIFQIGSALLVLMLAAGLPASAQRKAAPLRPGLNNPRRERRMLDLPPRWVGRLRQMSPQEQEKFLQNNERFRNLPPQRQAQIRQQLQRWNKLTPAQRQTLLNRAQVWNRLTPKQQNYVRDTLLPQWQNTPPARRQAILGKLRELRGLDEDQRTAKLNDGSFLGDLNSEDRQMLRDLSNLRVAGPEPPDEPDH